MVLSDWKSFLYSSYVSSGHIRRVGESAEEQLRTRKHFFESIIRDHFPEDRETRILDIGCGHGALVHFLRMRGYSKIRGVDGSAEQVELARRLGIIGVEQADAADCLRGCQSGSVDVIAFFDILEHFTRQEVFDLLIEARRVLAVGGRCIGHVPNAGGIFGSTVRYGDLTHEQAFTPSSISQMFGALQFGSTVCFEDKPAVHGVTSLIRRMIWEIGTVPFRVLYAAETVNLNAILSQNLLFVALRESESD